PKIVYDRAFAKTIEAKQKIDEFRNYLKTEQIPVLNPVDYADLLSHKIEFHKFLIDKGHPTLEALPVDYLLTNEFQNEIEQRKTYYLKPTFGTGGLGISIIEKEHNFFTLKNHTNTT